MYGGGAWWGGKPPCMGGTPCCCGQSCWAGGSCSSFCEYLSSGVSGSVNKDQVSSLKDCLKFYLFYFNKTNYYKQD